MEQVFVFLFYFYFSFPNHVSLFLFNTLSFLANGDPSSETIAQSPS